MSETLETALVAANRWLLIVLLAAMACIVFANVALRYTTGDSIIWAEEVSRHIMIWMTFLGAGLVLRFGGHVAIDNLHQAVGAKAARLLRALILLGVVLFCLAMAWTSLDYLKIARWQTTPATGISFAWVYAALPVGFVLVALHAAFIARGYVRDGRHASSPEMDAQAAASL